MTIDWNGGPSAGPGKDGDATTPGAGKDGESTTMLGICIGRFSADFCEGPGNRGLLVGTGTSITSDGGSFGEDLSIVVSGVERLDPGEEGALEVGVEDTVKECLNCETLDGFEAGVEGTAEGPDGVCAPTLVVGSGSATRVSGGRLGPTFTTSPFFAISNTSLAADSISSSLSPSSPPISFPFSSFPSRTAAFNPGDWAAGSTELPSDCEGSDEEEAREDLKRDTGGFGGAPARVASSGTSCVFGSG